MAKLVHLFAALAALAGLGSGGSAAFAQATRSWVSGTGNDANPCTRTSPCQTFAGAISRTAAGGEINCVDSGGFGVLTITKSISIRCTGGEAGVLATSTSGIVVNAAATDQIVLDGLDIEGVNAGLDGISIQTAGAVLIKNCNIHQFSGNGVTIVTGSMVRVIIRSSTIGGNKGSGVVVNSTPGFGHVRIFESIIHANTNDGVQVNGTGNEAIIAADEFLANYRHLNVSSGVAGGAVYSLGNNVIPNSAGDSPTPLALR